MNLSCFLLYKIFFDFSSRGVKYIMPRKLTTKQAEEIVSRLCKPPYDPDEGKLREAAWKLLGIEPEYDFGDDDENGVEVPSSALKEEIVKESFMDQVKSQVSSVGAAGVMAFSSAAYFQVDTIIEESAEVNKAAIEVGMWENSPFEYFSLISDLAIDTISSNPTVENNVAAEQTATTAEETQENTATEETPEEVAEEETTNEENTPEETKEETVEEEVKEETTEEKPAETEQKPEPKAEEAAQPAPKPTIEAEVMSGGIGGLSPHFDFPVIEPNAPVASPAQPL